MLRNRTIYNNIFKRFIKTHAITFNEYGDPNNVLKLKTYDLPTDNLSKNEIIVKFIASPINPADINQIEGVYPSKPVFIKETDGSSYAIGGNEGAMEIIAVGSEISKFKPGDWAIPRHTKLGTWRSYASLREEDLSKINTKNLNPTPTEVATVSVNPCTAYRMLKDFVPLKKGDWFIQNGANSAVGRAAIQLGRIWGLNSINIIRGIGDGSSGRTQESLDKLIKELKDLGATVVLTDDQIATRGFSKSDEFKSLTKGAPVRLALNCVGGKSSILVAKLLANGGHFVTYGAMARQPISIPASFFIFKDLHFHGEWVSVWSDAHPEEKLKTVNEILTFYKDGLLKEAPADETIINTKKDSDEVIWKSFKSAIETQTSTKHHNKQVVLFQS